MMTRPIVSEPGNHTACDAMTQGKHPKPCSFFAVVEVETDHEPVRLCHTHHKKLKGESGYSTQLTLQGGYILPGHDGYKVRAL